jgi:hypothetical protein
MSTSPGAGSGRGLDATASTSGGPGLLISITLIAGTFLTPGLS